MKKSLTTAAVALISSVAVAQDNQLSFGLDLALPMGDFADSYSLGIGPAVGFELPVGDNLGVTLQVSYMFLTPSSDLKDFIDNASMLPVQAGLKYYFQDQQEGLYGHAQLGIHSSSVKTADIDLGPLGTIEGTSDSSTNFSWGIGVGYQLEKFDIGLRYNSISPDSDAGDDAKSSTYLGLRIAYLLPLGS